MNHNTCSTAGSSNSPVDGKIAGLLHRLFGFDARLMNLRTEVVAGITTFMTMCYILVVNPDILSATGADKGALFTATAVAGAVATLLIAFLAKLPFAQAPGMGINAFIAFTVVQGMGYSWGTAMAVMLVEGLLFLVLTLLNVREIILHSIPLTMRYAISTGIGMFIAFIGLKNAGIIVADASTFVALGPLTPAGGLAIGGIVLSGILMYRGVRGALFIGIALCTLVGIPLGVTVVPDGFAPLSLPPSPASTFCGFDFTGFWTADIAVVVFTLLFMNIFDTMGTLVGLAGKAGIVDRNGEIPQARRVMLADALGTTVGALMGSSTVTLYVESASGVAEGGRSGVAALTTGMLFLLALFVAPLFILIPTAATTGALVVVGVLMMDGVQRINLDDLTESLPAFVTILSMTLTYSIANGMILGLLCYILVKVGSGRWREVSPTMYVLGVLFVLNFLF